MINSLTFDIEDWYQSTYDRKASIRDVVIKQTSKVLSILDDTDVTATFFVLGLVAEAFPKLVRESHKLGHEIATHGYAHELVFTQTPLEFARDLDRSIKVLEDITGQRVIGYRAPDFSITNQSLWALDVLEQSGIVYDSSIFPIFNRRYGIPGFKRHHHCVNNGLIEFPLSTVRILGVNLPVCGGGYFRLLPYPIIRSAISRINDKEREQAVVYMHPYEFDPDDLPKLVVKKSFLRYTQNINRSDSEMKLRKLLKDFNFTTVAKVLNIDE